MEGSRAIQAGLGLERHLDARVIRNVLATPLEVGDDGVVLGQLTRSRRIAEMEFSFPLDRVTPLGLREVFAAYPAGQYSSRFAERLGSLGFAPLRGMMRGFIDLVFEWRGRHFLIDWKSNSLGDAVESYARGRLQEVMESRFYVLQYHLYAVALHRYLSWRIPGYSYEKDFGGAFYVFLRGVDPARGPEAGIYFDRPPVARIEALNRLLSPEQPLLRWGAHVAHEK